MKIAITSTGKTLDSQVDPRFGRAACFIIIDTKATDSFNVFENENVASGDGAGISSAKVVIDNDAEAVLTGNCGPNTERTLTAAGVKLYTGVTGTVEEAIERFKNGKLSEASGPNVEPHFGMDK